MNESSVTVFVEVRYRQDHSYGGALESIDARKQYKLRCAAEHYLLNRHGTTEIACRFDVILITGTPAGGKDEQIDWIQNAL
jgi:putative endonuclease